jgi:TonB family protein
MLEEPAPEFVPHLLAQLEDELARSRKREAYWISVVVHIIVVLLIVFSPQLLPDWARPHLLRAGELARGKEPTFLALPQDEQRPPAKVESNKLSDKNRRAMTRHPQPQIDRKTLEALRSQGNQLPPGPPEAQPEPQAAESAAPSPPPIEQAPPPMEQPAIKPFTPKSPPQSAEQSAENPFRGSGSAGTVIADATRNPHPPRFPRSGGGGAGYGIGPVERNANFGPVEVLSDTQGVEFGPYLSRVLSTIKINWYNLVPEEARPPLLKHGKVAIRFLITPNGKVAGLNVELPSGDIPLDRAAYGGITASDPFSPLPREFHGPYLALRITFYYNPTIGELEELLRDRAP